MAVFGAPAAHASVIQMTPNNIGLVGYWSFNEGTSTIAHDFSGHGNTGYLGGSTPPQWVAGKLGNALNFDGSSSYIFVYNTGNAVMPTSNSPFTIALWLKPTSLSCAHTCSIMNNETYNVSGFRFAVGSAGAPYPFQFWTSESGGTISLLSDVTPAVNTWYHVAISYNGTTATMYVNGAAQSTPSTGNYIGNTNGIFIGYPIGGKEYFPGLMDEIHIYNRALTATEVAGLYQSGAAKINSSQSPGTLSNGLVGWWTMDGADTVWSSATAGNEIDKSGNGNTGTLTSMNRATSAVVGKIGQALKFDGSSSWVSVADNAGLDPTVVSVFAWVKRNGNQTWSEIVSKHTGSAVSGYQLEFYNTSNDLGAYIRGSEGGGVDYDSGYQIPDNTWTHVGFTYDGSTLHFYANGSAVGSPQSCTNCLAADSRVMGIGVNTSGYPSLSGFFSGSIDDVRVYNRALSASEVQQLYGLGAGTHINTSSANLQSGSSLASGLMGLWTFDGSDISGSTVYDLSGNGNNGTNNGATPTIGKLGQALKFDGSSSYVSLPDASSFGSGTWSIGAWIKLPSSGNTVQVIYAQQDNILFVYSGNTVMFQTNADNSYATLVSSATLLSNTWYYVVAVHSGGSAGQTKLYVNGVQGDDGTAIPNLTQANSVRIGSQTAQASRYFGGSIDEVRMYNRALSAREVQQLYLMGK